MLRSVFKVFAVMLVLVFFAHSKARAGSYSSNAFAVSGLNGESLLINRDIECIAIEKSQTTPQTAATIKVDAVSRRYFQDYTRTNLGKEIQISVCGEPTKKLKIQSVISTGTFLIPVANERQEQCLRDTFKIEKSCSDCPVCKN